MQKTENAVIQLLVKDDLYIRWGYFNQKANTDIIGMDAAHRVEMLFWNARERQVRQGGIS